MGGDSRKNRGMVNKKWKMKGKEEVEKTWKSSL
jgi:hypothetical protein